MSVEDIHPACLNPAALLAACEERRVRRSGPGGQHRNKVETGIVLHHRPTGVEAEANERRSQAENRQNALTRLRLKLALEIRVDRNAASVPSRLWQRRCQGNRIVVSRTHADFPALLAEALDTVASHGLDVKAAAIRLGCSASQLVKLLKAEPAALAGVNAQRRQLGLKRLR